MDHEAFKDISQGISSIFSTIAITIGAVWALWKFVLQKERTPRAEFDISAEFLGKQNGKWIIEVSAKLANKGKVRHLMKDANLNIRYLTKNDKVEESIQEGHFKQIFFPNSIGKRKAWWDSYIDPSLEFRNSYLASVPEEATYILILCKFNYEKDVWPAQRVLKVPQ